MSTFWPVLSSYPRRWQFWVVLLLWLCQFVPFAMVMSEGGRTAGSGFGVGMLAFAVIYGAAAIGVQTKEHLGAYRAALVPGYRLPHLAAAGLWLAVAVLPFPGVAWACGHAAWGWFALALCLASLAFAACCRGGWRAGVLFGGCVLFSVPPVAKVIATVTAGSHPWAAIGLVLLGLWFLAETVLFLVTMSEETPGYDVQWRGNLRQLSSPQARRGMFAAIRRLERENSLWLRLADAQMPAVMPFLGTSHWRRLRHWRRAQSSGVMATAMGAITWLLMLAMHAGMAGGRLNLDAVLRGSTWVLVMMPQMAVVQAWQMRGGVLVRELTYPVRRRDILIEQGLGILLTVALSWLLTMGTMAMAVGFLATTPAWRVLAIAALVSGPWQLGAFAALTRLATSASTVPMVAALIVCTGAGTAVLLVCIALDSLPVAAGVGGGLALLGLLGIIGSHRHWQHVDIA